MERSTAIVQRKTAATSPPPTADAPTADDASASSSTSSTSPSTGTSTSAITLAPERAATSGKRKRRRRRSHYKRDLLGERIFLLQLDVNDLKTEIDRLHVHRELLFARVLYGQDGDALGSMSLRVCRTFFDVVGNSPDRPNAIAAFRATTAREMRVCDTGYPGEQIAATAHYQDRAFMERLWKQRYAYCDDVQVKVQQLVVDAVTESSVVVHCTAGVWSTISQSALQSWLPSLLADERIVRQLVGQRTQGQLHTTVVVARATRQIVQFNSTYDVSNVLIQALRSPGDMLQLCRALAEHKTPTGKHEWTDLGDEMAKDDRV